MNLPYSDMLTPNLIWNIEQNKPTLVAKDLSQLGIPEDITYSILLGRGIFKWLAVRRQLIKLKNEWKSRITVAHNKVVELKHTSNTHDLGYYRGYLKALEECRGEVRGLCHSPRWQAPDYDKEANRYLQQMENNHVEVDSGIC